MDKFLQSSRDEEQRTVEQAARWHLIMQHSPSQQERAAFDQWLMDSRRNVRNYLLVAALDRELTQIDPERRLEIDDLQGHTQRDVIQIERDSIVERIAPSETRAKVKQGWQPFAGLAAVLIVAVALGWWHLDSRYSTRVGEQRIVRLEDGSMMHLNTRSRVKVEYSQQARNIRLVQGEALFEVARDTARPFRVITGTAVVQALGTQFNVYRRDRDTAIAVLEGRVQVFPQPDANPEPDATVAHVATNPVQLGAGEAANVGDNGHVAKRKGADVGNAVAWRDRRLIFRESALAEIAHEFNRYNSEVQLRVEGASTATRRYSGIFDAYDPTSLMQVLAADRELALERTGNEVVIRRR